MWVDMYAITVFESAMSLSGISAGNCSHMYMLPYQLKWVKSNSQDQRGNMFLSSERSALCKSTQWWQKIV